MMLIDSHTHLLHNRFVTEEPPLAPAQMVAEATAAGVGRMVTVACQPQEWAPSLEVARALAPHVGVAVGVHPQDVQEGDASVLLQDLVALAADPYVVALGETGLDAFYAPQTMALQRRMFETHLHAAAKTGLPVVVHTRDAEPETLEVLEAFPGIPFVLHCFTGSARLALRAVELGGYISFSGILTFKKSQPLREIAAQLPRDRVLVETDAPYLAPEPHRGRRNTPAMVAHTAGVVADLWQCSLTEAAEITTANTLRLFSRLSNLGGRS